MGSEVVNIADLHKTKYIFLQMFRKDSMKYEDTFCYCFSQALADIVKEHINNFKSSTKQFELCCPLCTNPACQKTKEFFFDMQGILDHFKERREHMRTREG